MSAKKSTSSHAIVDVQNVLSVFRERKKPLTVAELLHGLNVHKRERQTLFAVLDELVEQGKLIKTKNAWGLTESMRLITGILEIQRSGVGFVIPEDKRRKDVFISPRDMGDAWHGDRVVAAVTRERTGRSNEGRIARILERGAGRITARVSKRLSKGYLLCQPTDPRQRASFMVEAGTDGPAIEDVVFIVPGEQIDRDLWGGRIEEVLGREADVSVQEKLVKANHQIPLHFPAEVLDEAKLLPALPGEDDFKGRKDLRHLSFVTIDGAKARDFDDAVYVERDGPGYRLWVAIADVAHYVRVGSALDEEARERANSYYFPTSVEPMFPEALSNGLCSLNPNVPRLSMVAEITFDANGAPKDWAFANAVIQSHARLTYAQVNRGLLEKDPLERSVLKPVLPMLELAEELARKMNARRSARGSLDFDLPEPEILFNIYGETMDIRPKVRHFGHQIIEEFMVAANEAVAEFLTDRDLPLLYRSHPEPDPEKLKSFLRIISKTDLADKLPKDQTPGAKVLQEVLSAAAGTEAEFMVGRLALRSMMQAKYTPENEGHFGLASACYCHFTSPIRRYADLVVHRALKYALGETGRGLPGAKRLKELGEHLSVQERKGMEAEREILKRLTVILLRDKIGQEFTGVVNSMADFGFWVELTEVMAEGVVRLSSLNDDYYTFFPDHQLLLGERTGRKFKLGQAVRVRLEEVNLGRLEINLALLGGGEEARTAPGRPAGQKPRREDRRERGGRKRKTEAQAAPADAATAKVRGPAAERGPDIAENPVADAKPPAGRGRGKPAKRPAAKAASAGDGKAGAKGRPDTGKKAGNKGTSGKS